MKKRVKGKININANDDAVWKVIAHDFDKLSEWASGLTNTAKEHNGEIFEGAPMSGRVCYFDGGEIREQFTYYDEKAKKYGYKAAGKLPGPLTKALNNWSVTSISPTQCRVNLDAEIEVSSILSVLMLPFIGLGLKVMGHRTLIELKYFIENGKPHPRKLKHR